MAPQLVSGGQIDTEMKFDGDEHQQPLVVTYDGAKDVIEFVQEEVMSPNDSGAALSSVYSGNSMLA